MNYLKYLTMKFYVIMYLFNKKFKDCNYGLKVKTLTIPLTHVIKKVSKLKTIIKSIRAKWKISAYS